MIQIFFDYYYETKDFYNNRHLCRVWLSLLADERNSNCLMLGGLLNKRKHYDIFKFQKEKYEYFFSRS